MVLNFPGMIFTAESLELVLNFCTNASSVQLPIPVAESDVILAELTVKPATVKGWPPPNAFAKSNPLGSFVYDNQNKRLHW